MIRLETIKIRLGSPFKCAENTLIRLGSTLIPLDTILIHKSNVLILFVCIIKCLGNKNEGLCCLGGNWRGKCVKWGGLLEEKAGDSVH